MGTYQNFGSSQYIYTVYQNTYRLYNFLVELDFGL